MRCYSNVNLYLHIHSFAHYVDLTNEHQRQTVDGITYELTL